MAIQLSQFGIPDEEVRQFQPFIRLYSKGKVILQEGEETDLRIFLLRAGTVEVAKQMGDRNEVLSRIEAVNFFGEIAVVADRPRTATITAASDMVVVYAFDNPNLPAMLANPKWGILLVRRLAESVDHMNGQYQQAQLQLERLNKKYEQAQLQADLLTAKHEQAQLAAERLRAVIGELLGLFTLLHQAADHEALRQQFWEALPRLVTLRAKELKLEPLTPDARTLADYVRQGVLPEALFQAATTRPAPKT